MFNLSVLHKLFQVCCDEGAVLAGACSSCCIDQLFFGKFTLDTDIIEFSPENFCLFLVFETHLRPKNTITVQATCVSVHFISGQKAKITASAAASNHKIVGLDNIEGDTLSRGIIDVTYFLNVGFSFKNLPLFFFLLKLFKLFFFLRKFS